MAPTSVPVNSAAGAFSRTFLSTNLLLHHCQDPWAGMDLVGQPKIQFHYFPYFSPWATLTATLVKNHFNPFAKALYVRNIPRAQVFCTPYLGLQVANEHVLPSRLSALLHAIIHMLSCCRTFHSCLRKLKTVLQTQTVQPNLVVFQNRTTSNTLSNAGSMCHVNDSADRLSVFLTCRLQHRNSWPKHIRRVHKIHYRIVR